MADATNTKNVEKQDSFLAFVSDTSSSKAITTAIETLGIVDAKVKIGNFAKVIEYLKEKRSPKILMVDLSESELPISDLQLLSEVCEPGIDLIVLGARNDVGLFRELLQLGVSDYLVKPVNTDLVTRAVKKLLDPGSNGNAQSVKARTGKIVLFSGTRGGVGATTLAANTAWLLANEKGRRVALVDLDLHFGTTGILLDLKPGRGFREALDNPSRMDNLYLERIMVQESDRLWVLNAEESLMDDAEFNEEGIQILLSTLEKQLHYVIVDMPRLLTNETRETLRRASVLVSVSEYSMPAIRDAVRMNNLFRTEGSSKRIINVVNRDREYKEGALTQAEYERALGNKVDHTIAFDHTYALDAINTGQPVVLTKGSLSRGIRIFADDLLGVDSADKEEAGSLWRRLLK